MVSRAWDVANTEAGWAGLKTGLQSGAGRRKEKKEKACGLLGGWALVLTSSYFFFLYLDPMLVVIQFPFDSVFFLFFPSN